MRISSVFTTPYALPFRTPIRTARAHVAVRRGLLVRVRAGEVEGVGDAAPWPGFGLEAPATCEAALRRAGEELPGAANTGEAQTWIARIAADAPAAAGALSTALEDLAARRAGVPLAVFLGGATATPSVAVAALLVQQAPAALAAEGEARCREGFRTLKVKLLGAPDLDRRRLEALRKVAPLPVALRIDAGRSFRRAGVETALEGLARFAPEFVEEPLAGPDPPALRRLLRDPPVPLGLDESLADPRLREELFERGAAHVALVKPAVLGGPRRALRFAREARERGLRPVVTSFLDSAVGVAAALHLAAALGPEAAPAGIATSALLLRDVAPPPGVARGRAAVPARPGLGIRLACLGAVEPVGAGAAPAERPA